MARNHRILNEGDWFLGKDEKEKYPISYRYVICYCLFSYLANNDFIKDEGLIVLRELRSALKEEEHFRKENFIEAFPFKEDQGFVIIDQAGGIYPLVIYSKKREDEFGEIKHSERVSAFNISLDEVIEKYENIFNFLKDYDRPMVDWNTKDFQEKLFEAAEFKDVEDKEIN